MSKCFLRIVAFCFCLGLNWEVTLSRGMLLQSTDSLAAAANESASEWIKRQEKIDRLLSKVIPAVVTVDRGSGVIVSEDGLILTAAHVVGVSGRTVEVQLSDGRSVLAKTLGVNQKSDTAALRISEPGPWPYVSAEELPHSEAGQWCLALGYPSGFPGGLPASIRLGRILQQNPTGLISDCSIMGGDSGGPLFNLDGQLLGINRRVKHSVTHNHHISLKTFRDEWALLTLSGETGTPAPTPELPASYLGVQAETDQTRVRIRSVTPESPAAAAGLLTEDVILIFDGERISDFEQILQRLNQRQPGDRVEIIVNRYGTLISLTTVLGKN
jgi:serine protease Do